MYTSALVALRCPICHGSLDVCDAHTDASGELVAGRLVCAACKRPYPVRDGIADFLGRARAASLAQQTNEWPLTAWFYERGWRPFALTLLSGEAFPYGRELPLITDWLDVRRGGLFVDVGCSNGLYARAIAHALATSGGHVLAVDQALPMLVEARRRAREAGLQISFVRAQAQALPLAPDVADGVAIGGSLNEIGDLDTCLAAVRRVLAPDGRFVAMTLARSSGSLGQTVQRALGAGGLSFWSSDELVEQFARHGLRTLRREQHGIVLFTMGVPVER